MLNTLKQLKHQHFLKQKTKRRAARIEKLRAAGVSIGDSTYVCPTAEILPGARIGSGCWINRDIFIDCAVQIATASTWARASPYAPQATRWAPHASVQEKMLRLPS